MLIRALHQVGFRDVVNDEADTTSQQYLFISLSRYPDYEVEAPVRLLLRARAPGQLCY